MEQEILNRLQAQEELLQKVYASTEKSRKYLMWTFWGTVLFFVLPLVLLAIAIPTLLSSFSTLYGI
ncbi:MAG: hypothetical protein M0P64_01550 [Candidatus Pacebacteria bacterium]|jgi:uncharacterized membrane protein|nr:hypothetical protein [Candidatus Paceibacterota bacterium]